MKAPQSSFDLGLVMTTGGVIRDGDGTTATVGQAHLGCQADSWLLPRLGAEKIDLRLDPEPSELRFRFSRS